MVEERASRMFKVPTDAAQPKGDAGQPGLTTVVLVAGLLCLASSSVLLSLWWQRQLALALDVRPPVLLLDLSAAARGVDPAQMTEILRDYTRAAEHLAARGVLVLDRHAVLAAPPALTLRETEVPHAPE
ncbi:hypothetical protein [Thiocystis violascens]|uniref:Uncharacterized protein n=1 Tax=Thiocystis violascens (strain ATCC 17096 / DSM 198 / 6111) TaxID=765911 RepID=I3Y934_THIV6|nr:hypothetical protein [Thiocystis violascens]AFL73502.1 hypothetical protein Thivi_1501 [Thiocystis violascens DSM 198]